MLPSRQFKVQQIPIAREVHVETSIAIDKSPEELYAFWRDFKNLPLFMKNLESVTELDQRRSHWVAKGIGGIGAVGSRAELSGMQKFTTKKRTN